MNFSIKKTHILIGALVLTAVLFFFKKTYRENTIDSNTTNFNKVKSLKRSIVLNDRIGFFDENQEHQNTKKLFEKKSLVLYFSDVNNCKDCIQRELINLKDFFSNEKNSKFKITVLAHFRNFRDFLITHKKKYKDYPENVSFLFCNGTIVAANRPYYFKIDSTQTIKEIFYPDIHKPQETLNYIQNLKNEIIEVQ